MARLRPFLVFADTTGAIYDHPELQMLVRRGRELALPRPDELIPVPEGSDLYLLPSRHALGLNPRTGQVESVGETAVAAFVRPGFTLSATAAYHTTPNAPTLPLFAYAPVGYARGRLWTTATLVDHDPRQIFTHIPQERIRTGAQRLSAALPNNRLIQHLTRCALTFCCPAAKNLALGRFEAPLPTSRTCNARCLGCISLQPPDSGFPAPQNRIAFAPSVDEIVTVMELHARKEQRPIFSFGQGCEGEPLLEAPRIAKAIGRFRAAGGPGTVNMNTNASCPEAMGSLAAAGLSSIRVTLASAQPEAYTRYHNPQGFTFSQVFQTIREAKAHGLFVSLNYLFFPGLSDTEAELDALLALLEDTRPDYIQLRNLCLDPERYLAHMGEPISPAMGLAHFRARIQRTCPWIRFGYFNPYLLPDGNPLLWDATGPAKDATS
jgi:wyosine [tRNA(Phe)-imidazoG37] synthetase (radical SAM superfamily)